MPASRASHRKTTDHQSPRINWIMLLHSLHGFQHVDFACKLERIAEAAIRVQHKSVCRSEFPGGLLPVRDELQFRQMVITPMQPNIQTVLGHRFRPRPYWNGEACGYDQSIGLDRTVDPRYVAAHHPSSRTR